MTRPLGSVVAALFLTALCPVNTAAQSPLYDYSEEIFEDPVYFAAVIRTMDSASGFVDTDGWISDGVSASSFEFHWGDGVMTTGGWVSGYPGHTYVDVSRDYMLMIVGSLSSGIDTIYILIPFTDPSLRYTYADLNPEYRVSIPSVTPTLGTRLYTPPATLDAFDESYFTQFTRTELENLLTLATEVELDFTNHDVYQYMGKFEQVVLRDSAFVSAFSLWYTDPVALGMGHEFMRSISYFGLFHEIGHNASINAPASFYHGGRLDGPGGALWGEALAYVYEQATAWYLVNSAVRYDLNRRLTHGIMNSLDMAARVLIRRWYEEYLITGMKYTSWAYNDSTVTENRRTFGSIAYKFMERAESSGWGYRAPLKRMMHFYNTVFSQDIVDAYMPQTDTLPADTFRATYMVAGVSYAFDSDLRSEFAALNFPISDTWYDSLMTLAGTVNTVPVFTMLLDDLGLCDNSPYDIDLGALGVFIDPDGDPLTYSAVSSDESVATVSLTGDLLTVTMGVAGETKVTVTADDGNGGLEYMAFRVSTDPGATDDDGDGVCPGLDNCVSVANADQLDSDLDGVGDACDNCDSTYNADQADAEGDGIGDVCDPDADNDGIPNESDNCDFVANLDQANNDGDFEGDACDDNDDNDAYLDVSDNCPFDFQFNQNDADGDGVGDVCDPCASDPINDPDEDGLCATVDNCPYAANADQSDVDGDGVGDVCDNCPTDFQSAQDDSDGDGFGDVCDACPGFDDTVDGDGDGIADGCDLCPTDPLNECGCCDFAGDFNNDNSYNIADVTAGIAFIFSGGVAPSCQDEGDFNGDNSYNIADVTAGIGHIFSGGAGPVCGTTGT